MIASRPQPTAALGRLPWFACLALALGLFTAPLARAAIAATDSAYAEPTFQRGVNLAHYTAIVMGKHPFGDPLRVSEADIAWIAAQGFDHVRLPVDEKYIVDDAGHLVPDRLEPINRVLSWARLHGLGVIFDMHTLKGASYADSKSGAAIYTKPALVKRAAALWRDLAVAYSDVGPRLRFELLNEPVAPKNELVNPLHRALIAAIRTVDKNRVLILDTNNYADFDNLPDLELPADDPHLVASIHYYRPFQFTHQGTSWTDMGKFHLGPLPFPGVMPDVKALVPAGHWLGQIAGQPMNADTIRADFKKIKAWSVAHGREVYVGEFGCYKTADPASRRAWYAAIASALQAEGLPWAVWEYNSSFGIRDFETGRPTLVLESIAPLLPAAK
jgi:endoglucanase